jgi:hypothetical protein
MLIGWLEGSFGVTNRTAIATVLPKDAQFHFVVVEDRNMFAAVFHQFGCIHGSVSFMVQGDEQA